MQRKGITLIYLILFPHSFKDSLVPLFYLFFYAPHAEVIFFSCFFFLFLFPSLYLLLLELQQIIEHSLFNLTYKIWQVNILQKLRHPHIVRYYDRIIDRENTILRIVMEYCPAGDLAALIKKCRAERTRILSFPPFLFLSSFFASSFFLFNLFFIYYKMYFLRKSSFLFFIFTRQFVYSL